jgi:hypothetical protein
MGREIRMVPPNWQHPRNDDGSFIAMLDQDMESALDAWIEEYDLWKKGEHPDQPQPDCQYLWDWNGGPPNSDWHRPEFTEKPTWFQVYETVSEGTPVTPPFATKDELIDHLVKYGDAWDQKRGHGGWSHENAKQFVDRGFAMTGMFTGGKFYMARDGA